MSFKRCPGSSVFAQPKPEALLCPDCGAEIEIWSDEALGRCPQCRKSIIRSESQSCVDWCKHARECLGEEKFRQYGQMKAQMRKPALLAAAAGSYAERPGRMEVANKILAYAEAILAGEPAADPHVVIAAALLWELAKAEKGTAGVESVLKAVGYSVPCIGEVVEITDPGASGEVSLNARIVQDAVRLAEADRAWVRDKAPVPEAFQESLQTPGGRKIAREMVKLGEVSPGRA